MEFQVNVTKLGLFAYYLSYLLLLIYMAVLEDVTQIRISPIKRTTRKIRRLASAELCATSKYEVVGCLSRYIVVSSLQMYQFN